MLKLIEYTPAAKQRSFDPYNSAVNVAPAFTTKHSRSEQTANVLLAKTAAANGKRYS
jgi:hypothetical protein